VPSPVGRFGNVDVPFPVSIKGVPDGHVIEILHDRDTGSGKGLKGLGSYESRQKDRSASVRNDFGRLDAGALSQGLGVAVLNEAALLGFLIEDEESRCTAETRIHTIVKGWSFG
jgi:hypothetical protein